jgi:hypothetical protein
MRYEVLKVGGEQASSLCIMALTTPHWSLLSISTFDSNIALSQPSAPTVLAGLDTLATTFPYFVVLA